MFLMCVLFLVGFDVRMSSRSETYARAPFLITCPNAIEDHSYVLLELLDWL